MFTLNDMYVYIINIIICQYTFLTIAANTCFYFKNDLYISNFALGHKLQSYFQTLVTVTPALAFLKIKKKGIM